ncbi:ABC transporter [Capsaspora owczarzaki ATCC 30864]|uniref:ABC transporter n=1 Tax=Capsaspora owczarzaki (strain ATCC 30864) TaxID=595528 RepID=A0A0D2VT19_CAPO3|nr:ABC transporter [Capsaspora owczarzaki ATCC 30864]KJE94352.1 ABC transporter [Capsaspora owczarzaki ATCC 30864]|eukprot:XP_004346692.1 ABC transporter [Capsaspora owczarzaki ATCC 30864]
MSDHARSADNHHHGAGSGSGSALAAPSTTSTDNDDNGAHRPRLGSYAHALRAKDSEHHHGGGGAAKAGVHFELNDLPMMPSEHDDTGRKSLLRASDGSALSSSSTTAAAAGSNNGAAAAAAAGGTMSSALLAIAEARLDPTRVSHTDPKRALFPQDFKQVYHPLREQSDDSLLSNTSSPSANGAGVIVDLNDPNFDMCSYYVDFVERFFPGRMLGAFVEFRDISFKTMIDAKQTVSTVWSDMLQTLRIRDRPSQVEFTVLDGISGYMEPGDMVAILGGPSCGKTSLIKAIANRLATDRNGTLLINGSPIPENFNRVCGYVAQSDIHTPTLTVRETFEFAAELQLPREMTMEQRNSHIDVILKLLGLEHAANTLVGNALIRGISGGEKKRVTIGVEMLKTPNMLLLDEPTTGLDSAAAFNVLSHVRSIADVGFPCMAALLQPSKELYELFNQVCILSQGQITYFGPRGRVLDYFAGLGLECPEDMNPAEFLAQCCDHPEKFVPPEVSINLSVDFFVTKFRESDIYASLGRRLWKGVAPRDCPPAASIDTFGKYPLQLWSQFKLTLSRALKMQFRDPTSFQARLGRGIITAVLFATVFLQLSDNQRDSRNKLGVITTVVGHMGFLGGTAIPQLLAERDVYLSQRKSKYFQPFAYFLAVNLADLPLLFAEVTLFVVLIYFLVGLNATAAAFFYFFFMCTGSALWSTTYARALSALIPSINLANAIIPSSVVLYFIFNGFLLPPSAIRNFWIWMYWISPMHYSYEGLAMNEFMGRTLECDADELIPPANNPLFNLPFSAGGFNGTQVCPLPTGDAYLGTLGAQLGDTWYHWDIIIIYVYWLVWLFISFFCIKYSREFSTHNPHFEDAESLTRRRALLARKMLERRETDAVFAQNLLDQTQQLMDEGRTASTAAATANSAVVARLQPNQKAFMEFSDLKYDVQAKDENNKVFTKTLLQDINGYVKPGTLVALMGPSGAGKTTLLDVLADRKTSGQTTGSIKINGGPRNVFFKRISGYCEQQDIHFALHTVKEAITFAAMCRLPESISIEEKQARVEKVMYELDMEDIANDLIGTISSGGLSPEQRKRLTIAVELIADPPLLFLDEPTSGLDAFGAALVMSKIRQIAQTGRAVICTIHQPSAEIFGMFDHLLLLKKGGHQVFFGPVGERSALLLAYVKAKFGIEFQHDRNVADWVLDTVCETKEVDCAAQWRESSECRKVKDALASGVCTPDVKPPHFEDAMFATGFRTQLAQVMTRTWLMSWRNPTLFKTRLVTYLFMSLVLGSLFWQLEYNEVGATGRIGMIFFGLVFMAFISQSSMGDILELRAVFYREKASGTYRASAMSISLLLCEYPFHVVYLVCFVVPFYWMTNLSTEAGSFFFFLLIFFVTYLCANTFAQTVAVYSANQAVANVIAPTFSTFFFLLAGFLIPIESMSWIWRWFAYCNYMVYAVESLALNEFQGKAFVCDRSDAIPIYNPYNYTEVNYFCRMNDGQDILNAFDLKDRKWGDFGILLGYYAGLSLLVILGMRFYSALKR